MNKKRLNEFIPLGLFLLSGTCVLFNVPEVKLVMAISCVWISGLYFYGAFWLYSDYPIPLVTRIVAGLLFSVNTVACGMCFLNWSGQYNYGIANFCGLGILIIIELFNYKSAEYKPLFYRTIFFIIVFCLLYGYRRFL